MPGTELPEVFAAQVFFWVLLPFVLFASPRWSVLAWLVMGNLDASGLGSSISVGWINATKAILLPAWICWRMRKVPSETSSTPPARLWIALTLYATVAALWSPFPLPSAKLVGNMIGTLLALVVLEKSARKGLLDSRTLTMLILASLGLGLLQTYYYGGANYGFDGTDQPSRFSSFVAAQQYAAFLVAFIAIVLWHGEFRAYTRVILCIVLSAALLLNGSRVWFLGAIIVLTAYLWFSFRRVAAFVALGAATFTLFVMFVVNLTTIDGILINNTSNRIAATLETLLTGQETSRDVGLRDMKFRSLIYQGVLSDVTGSSVKTVLVGHGTSSGADAVMRVFPQQYRSDTIDANRVIHNEWLRALYEWGIVGVVLLLSVFGTLLIGLAGRYRDPLTRVNVCAVCSFLPAFLAAFSTENVLAGAGNAVTMSLALLIAFLWIPRTAAVRAHR